MKVQGAFSTYRMLYLIEKLSPTQTLCLSVWFVMSVCLVCATNITNLTHEGIVGKYEYKSHIDKSYFEHYDQGMCEMIFSK